MEETEVISTFEEFGLSNELLSSIQKLGFTKPTQIQEKSIPHIIQGKDVIGESATGSGKTLAFGCGIIDHVTPKEGIQALILIPTRELCEQIKDALKLFSDTKPLSIIAVYGGVSMGPQIRDLTRADIVVATPGRLMDHMRQKTINTSKIKLLVLDEADRMLDIGFINTVEDIIRLCPKKRQTLLFSATLSTRIKELANRYMNNPMKVSAEKLVDPSKLEQVYYDISKDLKFSLLLHLLKTERFGLDMIFCNTRRTTEFVFKNLRANKINAIAIHGGLAQNKRIKTLEMFNNAKIDVLVCTDVASRGLDIDNVSHIYNYEIPRDAKDYVHRIGRTARAGESGKVINLLCDYDHENFSKVKSEYRNFIIPKIEKPLIEKVIVTKKDDYERPQQRRPWSNGQRSNSQRRRYN